MVVHVYFKENNNYKIKAFLNPKALFKDPIEELEKIISEYELENDCSLGENRELKALSIPELYLNANGVQVIEQELTDEDFIKEIIKYQPVVEI